MSKFWQKKYISKHTGAEIDEAVEAVLDGDVGTTVVANPTLAGTEPALTGLQVGDDKYAVGGGGMENPMTAAGDLIVGGADGAPGKLAKGTDGKVLKMVSGAPAWSDDVGISQTDADLRYLQLSGGTMTGTLVTRDIKIQASYYLRDSNDGSLIQDSNNDLLISNINKGVIIRTKDEAVKHNKNGTVYSMLDESMGLPVITTAPSAENTDGIKIVVLSSEPATKYDGYLYIITA